MKKDQEWDKGISRGEWISLLGLCLFVLLRVCVFILRVLPLFPAAGHEAPCRQQPRGIPVARVLHKPGHCQEKGQRPSCAPLLPLAPCSHQPQQHGFAMSPGHGDTEVLTGSKARAWELNVGQAVCRVLGCPPAQLIPHRWPERHHLLPRTPGALPFSPLSGAVPREGRSPAESPSLRVSLWKPPRTHRSPCRARRGTRRRSA